MTIKELKRLQQNVLQLQKNCEQVLASEDLQQLKSVFTYKGPHDISLSICRKTNGDYKGCSFSSEQALADLTAGDEDNLKVMQHIIALMSRDYVKLSDCIEGYIFKLKERRKQACKDFWKSFAGSILPWIVAALPYCERIITALLNR